jgi:tetratricopeptide (TPR) repeat protein
MAMFNSGPGCATKCKFAAAIFLFTVGMVFVGDAQNKIFAARAQTEFHRAQIEFQSNTNAATGAWQFARACFDFADAATNDIARAALARQGIAACRPLIAREPKSAPAHYYLGMNLAQLARTEILGALKLVKEMEREFKTTSELDEHFDYAGPARNLGLLCRDAPGWPASIGSKRKARDFLERAAKLAPDYPENSLNLIESYLQWKDPDKAAGELKRLDTLWPKAQTNFTGVAWEQSWGEWSMRRDAAREKIEAKIEAIPALSKSSK